MRVTIEATIDFFALGCRHGDLRLWSWFIPWGPEIHEFDPFGKITTVTLPGLDGGKKA